jgi:hypothetical protein
MISILMKYSAIEPKKKKSWKIWRRGEIGGVERSEQ